MRINSINLMLRQPTVIAGLFFTMLWLVSDFSTRFIKDKVHHSMIQTDYTFNEFVSRKLEKHQYEKINSLFKTYIIEPEGTADKIEPQGLTAEEQLKQSGTLSELFVDTNKLVLKGVIQDVDTNTRTALIQVTNIETAETTLERFFSDKAVFGYSMKILSSTAIELSIKRASEKQIITLTMFKVVKNETNS